MALITITGDFITGTAAYSDYFRLSFGFIGDPPGYETDNRWIYSVGLSYQCNRKMKFSGYLDGRTAIIRGNDDPLSMLFVGEYKLRREIL